MKMVCKRYKDTEPYSNCYMLRFIGVKLDSQCYSSVTHPSDADFTFSCLVCAIGSLEESPLCVGRRELFMFVVVVVAFVHHTCRSLCDCHLCDCHLVRLSFVCGCHCALVLCVLVICAIVICSISSVMCANVICACMSLRD